MADEYIQIEAIDNENRETAIKRATQILAKLNGIDPERIRCMMGVVVENTPEDGKDKVNVHGFVLGNDEELAKMFSSLVAMAREGITQVYTPQDSSGESKH